LNKAIRPTRQIFVYFVGVVNNPETDDYVFTMEDIKDTVISKRTFASYIGPVLKQPLHLTVMLNKFRPGDCSQVAT
jgi:hypothetical protein